MSRRYCDLFLLALEHRPTQIARGRGVGVPAKRRVSRVSRTRTRVGVWRGLPYSRGGGVVVFNRNMEE